MRSLFRWTIAPALALTTGACAAQTATTGAETAGTDPSAAAPAAATTGPVSVYDGVYTSEQAGRGESLSQARCAACHSPQSEWGGGRLLLGYSGRPAWELVSQLHATMPMDAPGSLSIQEYTDIVTYILQLNSIPEGSVELEGSEERL